MIDTRRIKDRRRVRFDRIEDALRDSESLLAAEQGGKLRATGNWTLGQALGHIAFWARAPFDGYPPMRRMPLALRLVMPLFKNRVLNRGLPAGSRIPNANGGTFGIEPMDAGQGLAELRAAFERLVHDCPQAPNPLFGRMTHDEWTKLNLRHAELHLSFFHPSE
jgi:hypothetical protein